METMTTNEPFVGSDFTAEDFTVIGTILQESGGVLLDQYHAACVKRRIATRIRELKLPGAQPYIELLRTDRDEVQRLSAALSLHVSTFYRDVPTFAVLRRILLERGQGIPPGQRLRWWSAGCAGGEEAYSLALLAAQTPELRSVEIIATDVSHEILEKARYGYFEPGRLSNLPPEELALFFSPEGSGYRIRPEYREMVRFVRQDLLSEAPYSPADLILCRHVLIYFNATDQEQVLRRFAEALPTGGMLVLGRTETLRDKDGLFTPINATERIYRRI